MAPRKREQNEELRAQRRLQIIEAAIPLFAVKGFDATSVSEVAKAAGMSHGTVFLYFPTKEALFQAAVMEPLDQMEEQHRGIVLGGGSPLERIRRMVREQIDTFAHWDSYVRLVHNVLGQKDRFPDLLPAIYGFTARYAAILEPVITEGQQLGELGPGDPRGIAYAYFAYLNGVSLIIDRPGSPYFQETVDAFSHYALRLFAPQ